MSETSEDRSKRIFINYLKQYEWTYQYTVFYTNYRESKSGYLHSSRFKRLIRKGYPNYPFLYRIGLSRGITRHLVEYIGPNKTTLLPYHTFITNTGQIMTEEFGDLLNPDCLDLFVEKRRFTINRLENYISTVKKGKPHDLKKFFNYDGKINRFAILNKSKATPSLAFQETIVKLRNEINSIN
jgi:hypothetical protein